MLLRFHTANPEGWDGSFLSSLPTWWSTAELGKPAQLLAARVGSGLAQPVELWACVPAIRSTPPHSHARQALAHQFHFGADFHQAGAEREESVLSSCLQKKQHSLRVRTTLSPSLCRSLPSHLAASSLRHPESVHFPPACRWHYSFFSCMQE